MRKIALMLSMAALLVSCNSTEEVATNDTSDEKVKLGKSYGPEEVDVEKAISVDEMIKGMEGKTERTEFTFEAELVEVCSKAGCWVNIDKGDGTTFMVRFKDHFTIPPATEVGTGAYLHGYAYMDSISVDLLRHFAEDAGKSQEEIMKITEPEYNLAFEADGITLKK